MRIAALALLLSVITASAATADDAKDIRATYDKFCSAIQHQNFAAIRTLETPDFTAQEGGRKLNGKQEETSLRQQFTTKGKVRFMRVAIRTISIRGKTAGVTTSFWYQAFVPLPNGAGKPHISDRAGSTEDTLVKTAGGWKFKTMSQSTLSVSVDGKRINPR